MNQPYVYIYPHIPSLWASFPPSLSHLSRLYIQWNIKSHKKKWNRIICSEVDGPRVCHTEWSKSEREKQIPYANAYIWNLKKMEFLKTWTTKSYYFLNTRHPCSPVKTLQNDPCYIVSWTNPAWFAVSHLALLAPRSVPVGILQGRVLLWGKFKFRGSFTEFPFSSVSVTCEKCRELGMCISPFQAVLSMRLGQ